MLENGKMQTCVRMKVFCQHFTWVKGGGRGQNAYRMNFPTLVTKIVDP